MKNNELKGPHLPGGGGGGGHMLTLPYPSPPLAIDITLFNCVFCCIFL